MGRGGLDRELLSAVNKQQKTELLGSLFGGMYVCVFWGVVVKLSLEAGSQGMNKLPQRGRKVQPTFFPSHLVPEHTNILGAS